MKDLAPHIKRQRMVLEGHYTIAMDEAVIRDYFSQVTKALSLRTYGEAIVFSPGGDGKAENQGYDAFIPLIDSGISGYFWTQDKFFSIIIYTCKEFDADKALEFTKTFMATNSAVETMSF